MNFEVPFRNITYMYLILENNNLFQILGLIRFMCLHIGGLSLANVRFLQTTEGSHCLAGFVL